MLNRRGLLLGLSSALAAPAIVHAGNLMPVKVVPPTKVVQYLLWSEEHLLWTPERRLCEWVMQVSKG